MEFGMFAYVRLWHVSYHGRNYESSDATIQWENLYLSYSYTRVYKTLKNAFFKTNNFFG